MENEPNPAPLLEAFLAGELEVVEASRQAAVYRVVVRRRPPDPRRRPSPQERRVIERLVRGKSQKEIAFELGIALTTVGSHLRVATEKLGLSNWECAVAVAAVLRRGALETEGDGAPDGGATTIQVHLAERALGALSPAEREVALLALDGRSNAEIGSLRRSSARTVANQMATTFDKLGVRGRLALVRRLVGEIDPKPGSVPLEAQWPPAAAPTLTLLVRKSTGIMSSAPTASTCRTSR
jgi:DNA-binding NarL/FixJ family response regulator